MKHIRPYLLATAIGAVVAMTGCSSTPQQNAQLDAATAQLSTLNAQITDPSLASAELKEAQDAVAAAQRAVDERADAAVVNHKIYVAQRKVSIADQLYRRKVAERALTQVNEQSQQLQLQARAAELDRTRAELAELKAKQSNRGMVMTLGDVMFDTGKYELKPGGDRVVDQLARFLEANPERRVRIEGFTDSVGSDEFNLRLSDMRAQSVKARLISAGIDPARIATQGYGEAFPVASNDSGSGRQLNRRVEIVISDDGGEIPAR